MITEANGWINTDNLISVLVLMIILASLINIIADRIDTSNSIGEAVHARILGENIAEYLESTRSNGKGYYTIYRTPPNLNQKYYILHINSSGLYLFLDGKTCYSHLGSMRVSGSPELRDLEVTMKPNRTYNISNVKDRLSNTWVVVREV